MKFIFHAIYTSFHLRAIIPTRYCTTVIYYKLACGAEGRDLFNYIFQLIKFQMDFISYGLIIIENLPKLFIKMFNRK